MTLPPNLTRRALLGAGAAGAATLAGLRTAAPAAAGPGHLVRSAYAGLTGQRIAAGPVALRLLSVADVAGAAVDARLTGSQDAFALAFSGPLGQPLPAGIHTFRHPSLGAVELFVSPVETPRADRRYEVVVDRSVGVPRSVPQAPAAPELAAPLAAPAAAPRRGRLLRRIAARRTARGARVTVALLPSAGAVRVHGQLVRRGRVVAVANRAVHDRRAVLRFRGRRLGAGRYTLVLTLVDEAGLLTERRRRVRLR